MPVRMILILLAAVLPAAAIDWPMWRFDAGRTAETPQAVPANPDLLWTRQLPAPAPAFHDLRLQFDRGHEPIVAGNRVFIASSREDSVTAYATATGDELWRFYAEGPVRLAPVAWRDRLFLGSDDGFLHCLDARTGEPRWKFRAAPSERRLIGNRRLISVWPVRGGPVVHEDRIYFAAGVWPFEGVFVYCLDAATGRIVWLNDRAGFLYGQQPHNAVALGGLAPQGYLLVDGDDLVVPGSNAYPGRFDRRTGALKQFLLPAAGRLPGGWYASLPGEAAQKTTQRKGLLADLGINVVRHEDRLRAEGVAEVRTTIRAAGREFRFTNGFPQVSGTIHSMVAADDKLFITTLEGRLHCLGPAFFRTRSHDLPVLRPLVPPSAGAAALLRATETRHGWAILLGTTDRNYVEHLLTHSELSVVVVMKDAATAGTWRRHFSDLGRYGTRLAVSVADPEQFTLPPHFANLIVADELASPDAATLRRLYDSVRPYGGHLVVSSRHKAQVRDAALPGATLVESHPGLTLVSRAGALAGATNYAGDWAKSADLRVKAPLGVLWFDDTLGHFKRAPQPKFVDGVMISVDKDWLDASTRKGKQDYRLLPPVFSDVYTGRILSENEAYAQRRDFAEVDTRTVQPSQYRPPQQKDDWKPDAPRPGLRRNPLTGLEEPRTFPKSYGCDGGHDYGHIYTMRSGTAAFYDKRSESGTINISGPRSGCSNSVIPANGVLNLPYFYKGCSCSYPLPTGLALVSLPPTHEQWTAWGDTPVENLTGNLQRVGINFGAPGDRMTDDGTLWVDHPNSGGPSPAVPIKTVPGKPEYHYRHSLWIRGGQGWPWVAASGAQGLESVEIGGLKPGEYTVRLVFAEPDADTATDRAFDVLLQGRPALSAFAPAKEAGGVMRAITKSFPGIRSEGTLTIELRAKTGRTLLSGVELIRAGLNADDPPALAGNPLAGR